MLKYKILVVNLKKRDDRKKNMIEMLNKYNINNYVFYEAFDGKEIELNLEIKNIFQGNDFFSRKGVIGCALSHYNIWLDLIVDLENDYYLIFEDDIKLSDNFKNYFEELKIYINSNNNTDILFLGYTSHSNDNKDRTNEELNYIIENLDRNKYLGGFFSYIITKNGAIKMIDYINKNGIKHGIDYLVKKNENIDLKVINPLLVFTDWVKDINDDVDSNIQKDYENFNFETIYDYNNYLFIKEMDIMNNDIKFLNNNNINILINECNKNIYSSGFNTLGFIKGYIDKDKLIKSIYFKKENDGIFIKLDRFIRIKIIGDWCNSEQLCKEWNVMSKGDCKWNNIKITYEDNDIDYYIIINKPCDNSYYNPEKTIIFQMEPYCNNSYQNWGVKTWDIWANPDPNKFLEVRTNKYYYNNCMWQLKSTYNELLNNNIDKKYNYLSTICSSKYYDPGHIKRIDFLKFIESKEDIFFKIDIYGKDNNHNFKNYKCSLPFENKDSGIVPYKYYFMAENNLENNYITEKLWEPIISECLCFYYGAPNVSEYINPLAYVAIDLDNFEESYNIINNAISNDLWSERIDIIRMEKYKILNYYNFYPTVERIINRNIWKNELELLNKSIKIYFIKRGLKINFKTETLIKILKEFNFDIIIYDYMINKEDLIIDSIHNNEKKIIYNKKIKYFTISNDKIISSLELINLYENLLEYNNIDNNNFLIIDENMELNTSLNNLFNHIKYLPDDYDICNLAKIKSICPLIISNYNSIYYNVKKYYFECKFPYFISKKGIEKILIKMNNNINIEYERIISHCYLNIDSFKFYTISNEQQIFI